MRYSLVANEGVIQSTAAHLVHHSLVKRIPIVTAQNKKLLLSEKRRIPCQFLFVAFLISLNVLPVLTSMQQDRTEEKYNSVLIEVLNSKQDGDKELNIGLTLLPVISAVVCSDHTEVEAQCRGI